MSSLLAGPQAARAEPVPLIDVLVMLIFFAFVTMQFKSATTLNITLPKIETAGKNEFKGDGDDRDRQGRADLLQRQNTWRTTQLLRRAPAGARLQTPTSPC